MYNVLVLLFCMLNHALAQRKEENDLCTIRSGQNGICKPFSTCQYAHNLLREGKRPEHCGFTVYEPIVCCISNQGHSKFHSSIVPNFSNFASSKNPSSPKLDQENIGALARKKCVDFHPKPAFRTLVIGGTPTLAKEFPHMAAIGFGDQNNIQWRCGGSLISYEYVLTAAHCLSSRDLGSARWVRLGDLDLANTTDEAQPQDLAIKRTIPHPLYQPNSRYHDIALIELDGKANPTVFVSPACLNTEHDLNQTRMTATGWGNVEFSGDPSTFLLKVDLDYVPNDRCTKSFGNVPTDLLSNGIVDDWQICAGGVVGQDTCQGDSGGPLQVPNIERTFTVKAHTIIGITSFGKSCGLSKAPGIYTRVSNYIPWIESIVWPNENADLSTELKFGRR